MYALCLFYRYVYHLLKDYECLLQGVKAFKVSRFFPLMEKYSSSLFRRTIQDVGVPLRQQYNRAPLYFS